MRKNYILLTVLSAFLCSLTQKSIAQTILAPGDIAFTGYNAYDNVKSSFSFVILRPGGIAANTIINFTDNGWNTAASPAGFGTAEGTLTWTAPALPAFSEVSVTVTGAVVNITGGGSASSAGDFILSQAGDQVLAYQGSTAAPVFISGIHMNSEISSFGQSASSYATWDVVGGTSWTYTQNRSALPPGLTTGTNAVMGVLTPGVLNSERDNGIYMCANSSAVSIAELRTKLNTPANWQLENQALTPFPLPTGCSYGLSLPVTFGPVQAAVSDGSLLVQWSTVSEQNCDHFDVEISGDGVEFTRAGTVASRSAEGHSSAVINYELSIRQPAANRALALSAAAFLGFLLLIRRRNRQQLLLTMIAGSTMLSLVSCQKGDAAVDVPEGSVLYVRIAQVDTDGTVAYSRIVKVTGE
ncbi:hypothetical protein [Niabella beijingensis]|uniref:hypothetical protein n=1 Tax=Niabella beijingensis TaxID=2872700 RepID=UPI001CBD0AFE|nr:hypothetical protein [Niabella beijingensis]MBZ4187870.1 hypothetical protein [Niabella beijingensis]